MHDDLKQKLIDGGRILESQGHRDFTRGHLSVRVPDAPELFYMKALNIGLEEITIDNIVTLDLDGNKVAGGPPRHGEAFIHSEIFRARPDVHAVVHTHPPNAVVFSTLHKPLEPIGQPSALFAQGLPVFSQTMELINTAALGRDLAVCLGQSRAMLLESHGIVVTGGNIEESVYLSIVLEDACRLQLMAYAAGGGKSGFTMEASRPLGDYLLAPRIAISTFDYLKRRLPARNYPETIAR